MAINCSSLLACPTCGPNCNYECQSGVCVAVPRDDNRVGGNPFGVAQISKTRGVPSMGSSNYGPRGQRQNFRSFSGTNWQQSGRNRETMWQNGGVFSNAAGGVGYSRFAGDSNGTMKTMSVGRLVMGYLAIGLTAFVIGYAIKKGCETAK